jgi:uncharacterized protein (TIGR00290 family)
MSREKIVLSWSGGKDSAFALFTLLKNPDYEVVSLLSTITREYDRLSMHGVRRILIEEQANATNLPLIKVFIPSNCTDIIYASIMESEMKQLKLSGINTVAFGDIYLQDVRTYRENNLAKVGMKCLFPLWGIDSLSLVYSFIDTGFKSITTCIDSRVLDVKFLGRVIDRSFLAELPTGIDPAGEKGEFHSFAFAGPVFNRTIPFVENE